MDIKNNEAELERFERTRLYKIASLKKEIERLKTKLNEEKSRFFKRRSTIEEIEFDIEMAEDELIKLQHQTGYDLYMESSGADLMNLQNIASAVEAAKNTIPGISNLFKF